MFIREAKKLADELVASMAPFCERVEIAGSIRRGCQIVKDIEIVAIPKIIETPPLSLFGEGEPERAMPLREEWALVQDPSHVLWIKPGTSEIVPWEPKPFGRYWRAHINQEIKLDLFLTSRERWGAIFLIRTGSAVFSQAVMTYAKYHTRFHFEEGALCDSSEQPQLTAEELDVFDALGLDYVEPGKRTGFQDVLKGGQPQFGPDSGFKRVEARPEKVSSGADLAAAG